MSWLDDIINSDDPTQEFWDQVYMEKGLVQHTSYYKKFEKDIKKHVKDSSKEDDGLKFGLESTKFLGYKFKL